MNIPLTVRSMLDDIKLASGKSLNSDGKKTGALVV